MYSEALGGKGDQKNCKMDDTMFTGSIFRCRRDENIFEFLKNRFRSQNDHFRAQNGDFGALSLHTPQSNQILVQYFILLGFMK